MWQYFKINANNYCKFLNKTYFSGANYDQK